MISDREERYLTRHKIQTASGDEVEILTVEDLLTLRAWFWRAVAVLALGGLGTAFGFGIWTNVKLEQLAAQTVVNDVQDKRIVALEGSYQSDRELFKSMARLVCLDYENTRSQDANERQGKLLASGLPCTSLLQTRSGS